MHSNTCPHGNGGGYVISARCPQCQAHDDQQSELAGLRARLKVLERIAYDLAMLVSDHVTEDVAGRDAAMGAYVEYLSKPNKR